MRDRQHEERVRWLIQEVSQLRLDQVAELIEAMVTLTPDAVEECLAQVRHPSGGGGGSRSPRAHVVPLRAVPEQRHT